MTALRDWLHLVSDISDRTLNEKRVATEEERIELARELDIPSCESLRVAYQIKPHGKGRYLFAGALDAEVTQACGDGLLRGRLMRGSAIDTIDRTFELRPALSPMAVLNPTDPVPRYLRMAQLLRQRIEKGLWKPGELLPRLEDLMAEFDVARVTARQAVAILAREGWVTVSRGRGTLVQDHASAGRTLHLQTSLADLADAYRHDRPTLSLIDERRSAIEDLKPREVWVIFVSARLYEDREYSRTRTFG